jgi:HSP20 family protein
MAMFTTYNLLNDINEMRGLLDNFFDNRSYITRRVDYPYINLYEKDDEIEIIVLAPGEKVEDINLELNDGRLIIEAEKKNDHVDKRYIRQERTFGKFRKTVELPYRVDPGKINASMKDGVLSIKLTKSPDAKPKRIEIH